MFLVFVLFIHLVLLCCCLFSFPPMLYFSNHFNFFQCLHFISSLKFLQSLIQLPLHFKFHIIVFQCLHFICHLNFLSSFCFNVPFNFSQSFSFSYCCLFSFLQSVSAASLTFFCASVYDLNQLSFW